MKKLKASNYIIEIVKNLIDKYMNGEMDKNTFLEEISAYNAYSFPKNLTKQVNSIQTLETEEKSKDIFDDDVADLEDINEEEFVASSSDDELTAEDNDVEEIMNDAVNNEKSLKVKTSVLTKMKKFLTKNKKKVIAGTLIATLAIGGGTAYKMLSNKGDVKTTDDKSKGDGSKSLDKDNNDEVLNENLNFDPLDKELEVKMMEEFFTDALPKGIELNDTELTNQVDQWIDFKNLANFEQFGINDLAKKYQNDKKTYIDLYNNYTACATMLSDDSLTASKEKGELIDLSKIFAEKDALELVTKFQDLNGRLVDARVNEDTTTMETIAREYNQLINDTLMAHDVDYYNPIAYDLSVRYARIARRLVGDYSNIQSILMDKTLEDVLAVNGDCYSGEQLSKILSGELPGATNKYSTNIIKFMETMKTKVEEMHHQLVDDNGNLKTYDNELSQDKEVEQIVKYIKDNNLLATYQANLSYEELYYKVKTIDGTGSTVPKNAVKVSDNKYVPAEEMAKQGVDVDAERAKGKSDEEILKIYINNVKKETEEKCNQESGITDLEGNKVESGVSKEEYSSYYTKGSEAGAKAAAGKTSKISDVSVPSSIPEKCRSIWKKAYIESYNAVVDMNLKAVNESSTVYEPTNGQDVSKSETVETSEPIKDENIKKPDTVEETTTTYAPSTTPEPTETPTQTPSTNQPTNTTNPDGSETNFVPIDGGTSSSEEIGEEIITYNSSRSDSIAELKAMKNELLEYQNYTVEIPADLSEGNVYVYTK